MKFLKKFFKKEEDTEVTTTEDKEKRVKLLIIAGIAVVFILILTLSSGGNKKKEPEKKEEVNLTAPLEGVDIAKEEWTLQSAARLQALEEKTIEHERNIQKLTQLTESLQDSVRSLKKGVQELTKTIMDLHDELVKLPPQPQKQEFPEIQEGLPPGEAPIEKKHSKIKVVEPQSMKSSDTIMPVLPPSTEQAGKVLVPAGSFGRVRFLAGVYAPCEGPEIPVLMEVISPIITPKERKGFIGSFIIGSAVGDESSKSAFIRLEKISFLYEDTVITKQIKGWVVGDDGKYGIRGKVHDRSGKYLAYAIVSSFASGVGQAVSLAYTSVTQNAFGQTTTTIDKNNIAKVAAASGTSTAAGTISEYYMKKASKIIPVVEVEAGTIADIVFLEDLKI